MHTAICAPHHHGECLSRRNKVFAATGDRDELAFVAIRLAMNFKQPVTLFETSRDGLMLQAADGEQVVIHEERDAGMFAAMFQFLVGGQGLHNIKGHAGHDEETEGEVEQTGCGLAGHGSRQLRRWRSVVVRSVFIIERNILERNEGKRDGTRIGGAGFVPPNRPDDSGALA